ncbi:efflux RND transporter permease subunit [Fundidesulfovibrio agrisoli]|uniref:efflux RND transporter permease subunit n=1 Tax=Fundidesulfovibrio agrisoli TaxID=2922717 RepID=UPI001FACAD2E|nr:efflux RND transporter permease subunit [Fundidesulfovibrio agrisoli]
MSLSTGFIRRPVMTTLVMAAMLIFGVMGYLNLPVSDLPNVDFPTIQVTATFPGASPETMAASVATPLEKQFSTIAGLDSMSSSSTLGITKITLQFDLNRNIDAAAQDVNSAIALAVKDTPAEMTTPPTYRKVNPADQPVLYLAITSPTMRLSDLNEYAETLLAQRISMVSGVSQVVVYGSQKYAVRVQLDPDALASREIGVDEVAEAVRRANVNLPTGTISGPSREFTVQATGQLLRAEFYGPIIVAYRNGSPVRLNEIGRAMDSVENDRRRNFYNGEPGFVLAVMRQPGTNTVAVVDAVKKLLPGFKVQLPEAVNMEIMIDRSVSIKDSVEDVKFTLLLTVGLVVAVIFLFLRNVSATLIPSLALPLSLMGTFALMYQFGFSLNNISLMALTLSVGFVVDDAIVMLENVVRHMEMGKPPLQAAYEGAKEVSFTILSMTISLTAVFIPVLFMGGVVGRLFKEFAVTICVAILFSGFVSLSLTPMLCSKWLRPHHDKKPGRFSAAIEAGFEALLRLYDRSLTWVIAHRRLTMAFSLSLLLVTGWLFSAIPKGFLPSEDIGQVMMMTEAEQGISFTAMLEKQKRLMDIVGRDENIEGFMSVVGAGGPVATLNSGRMFIKLKPRHERPLSADQLIQKLRPQLSKVPGIMAFLQNPPSIRLGGNFTKGLYQYTLQNPDTQDLFKYAAELEEKLKEVSMLQDVNSDLQLKNPQINLEIDRDKTSALGISVQQIEDALYTSYGTRQVSTIYAPNNSYQVIMEVLPGFQSDPSLMSRLYVRSPVTMKLVPLDVLVKRKLGVGPLSVNHSGQLPSVTISFNLAPGVSLSQAVEEVGKVSRQVLPASFTTKFEGTAQAFQSSMTGLSVLVILSIVVIYIVLGILYESFIHPLTILSGLPSAGVGALATLMAFGMNLDIYGFVGIIMLIGIVKKNAIMMIDFALEAQRDQNLSPAQAIYQGCLVRFRPIMMTTMAALMGTLPIALGFGAGAEARRPLGLAVVGGLMVSQLLTLFFTPVYYIYLDRFQAWLARGGRKEGGSAGEAAGQH